MTSTGSQMLSVLAHLRQNFLGLAILTAAAVILWAAGWEVIGILITVVGGFGLFLGLIAAAFDTGGDVVTEAYAYGGRPKLLGDCQRMRLDWSH